MKYFCGIRGCGRIIRGCRWLQQLQSLAVSGLGLGFPRRAGGFISRDYQFRSQIVRVVGMVYRYCFLIRRGWKAIIPGCGEIDNFFAARLAPPPPILGKRGRGHTLRQKRWIRSRVFCLPGIFCINRSRPIFFSRLCISV